MGEGWLPAIELARRQHWAISRAQLLELGVTSRQIEHRVSTGALHPLHRGVYAVGRRDVSPRGRWFAAVLACGEGAVLSHSSAAALWRIGCKRPRPLHVTSPRKRGTADAVITLHRSSSLHPDDVTVHDGIPATSVARTLVDMSTTLDPDELRECFEEADRLNVLELCKLAEACSRSRGVRGVGHLRALVGEAPAASYVHSPFESRFAASCRAYGLPAPELNAWVEGLEVDALWAKAHLIVELDSWEFHGRKRSTFERDRAREAKLALAGYLIYRLTWRRFVDEPATVAAELLTLITRRSEPRAA